MRSLVVALAGAAVSFAVVGLATGASANASRSAAAANRVTYTDPCRDADPSAPDITQLSVTSNSDGLVTFQFTAPDFCSPGFVPLTAAGLYVDSDYNSKTGDKYGTELRLVARSDAAGAVFLKALRWNGSDWASQPVPPTMTASLAGTTATIAIGAADLGVHDGFSFWANTARFDASGNVLGEDEAPNGTGLWDFDLTPPVPVLGIEALDCLPEPGVAGKTLTAKALVTFTRSRAKEVVPLPAAAKAVWTARIGTSTLKLVSTGREGSTLHAGWKLPAKLHTRSVRVTLTLSAAGQTVRRAHLHRIGAAGWMLQRIGQVWESGDYPEAAAINDRGQVAVNVLRGDPLDYHVLLWESGKLRDLGTLGGEEAELDLPEQWVSHPQPGPDVLNDRGQVIGTSATDRTAVDEDGDAYAIWRGFVSVNGKLRDLGSLSGDRNCCGYGSSPATPVAINELGQVVGVSDTGRTDSEGYTIEHPFIWQNGKMRDLGTLGSDPNFDTWEYDIGGINDRGQVVGASPVDRGVSHAFLWQSGRMRDLGTLGGPQSSAVAVNDQGQVIGWADAAVKDGNGRWISRAFLWQDGRMQDLGSWGAVAINERGQIIGSRGTKDGRYHAVLWQNGKLRDLGVLLGDHYSEAIAINERGQIVGVSYDVLGGRYEDEAEGSRPFVWEDGKMTALPMPPDAEGTVAAMNERGQIIGEIWSDDDTGAFLWTLVTGEKSATQP